ncbi:hypothetical protein J2R76_005814 [Bradyrhizobium sp. USDA 4532]|uniref:hypothetical protein n=1 Tax=unclassified Bradyrhizobium TaxID=2631580 RepID=UPI0020A1503C|nr:MULTISPECIES: hypothetical protein [unclassified Bradyrhizobium]MCP1829114.1 hypothetical protein [Bradyrhizobium sp. USDA 4545]MCP1922223.1 hypothetical protein [Bradyrhizobium sp. USDA 4532]
MPLEMLVANIDCEFKDAVRYQIYRKGHTWLKTWQGQYTVTLKGNETGGAKLASTTTPIIISSRAGLNFGAGGGLTTTANRTAILKFNLDFSSVKDGPYCVPPVPVSGHPMLAGKIGFEEWMDRAFAGVLSDPTIQAKTSSIASLGHTFEFSLDLNANASPVFTIVPAPTTTLTPTATIDRLEDNIVDVSLGKAAGATDTVSKTTAKYDAEQLKVLAEIRDAIKDLTGKVKDGEETLAKGAPLLAQAKEAERLTQPNIMSTVPEDQKSLMETKRSEAFKFLSDNSAKIQELQDLDATVKTQRRDLVTAKGQLIDTLNHPTEQTTTKRTVQATSPLSPDQNPNVTNTQLQLTFERLNNNLRVPVP